ncbi:DUF2459 domain-containing protein [Acidithiobacillus sp.]
MPHSTRWNGFPCAIRTLGTYDAFYTCNTWTATALHIAGLPVDPQGVLFARQVMSAIQRLSANAQPTICQGAD